MLPHDTVTVDLGDQSYDILIGDGLLGEAGAFVKARFGSPRTAIVTDTNVADHHLATLQVSLDDVGIGHESIMVEAGEGSKCFATLQDVVHRVLDARLERGDLVLALGGGVVGDLGGFAASIVRRGMTFVQIPTSLLAQVDSSVGGKTGINTEHGKNLVGAFHQPGLVLADTATINTLSERHKRAGYAEIAKYGLISDAPFFDWLGDHWHGVLNGADARREAVAHSCRAKAAIVAEDEREKGRRALLNLGHTFGHALEGATGYGERLVHGEAIAIGMVLAHRFSHRLNLASIEDAERVEAHFKTVGLPTKLSHIEGNPLNVDQLMTLIAQDKKVKRGALTFILTNGIGKAFIADDVPASEVQYFLKTNMEQ